MRILALILASACASTPSSSSGPDAEAELYDPEDTADPSPEEPLWPEEALVHAEATPLLWIIGTSPDGRYLAWLDEAESVSGRMQGNLRILDLYTGAEQALSSIAAGQWLGWSEDGRRVAWIGPGEPASEDFLWSTTWGETEPTALGQVWATSIGLPITPIELAAEGDAVAVDGVDGTVHIWRDGVEDVLAGAEMSSWGVDDGVIAWCSDSATTVWKDGAEHSLPPVGCDIRVLDDGTWVALSESQVVYGTLAEGMLDSFTVGWPGYLEVDPVSRTATFLATVESSQGPLMLLDLDHGTLETLASDVFFKRQALPGGGWLFLVRPDSFSIYDLWAWQPGTAALSLVEDVCTSSEPWFPVAGDGVLVQQESCHTASTSQLGWWPLAGDAASGPMESIGSAVLWGDGFAWLEPDADAVAWTPGGTVEVQASGVRRLWGREEALVVEQESSEEVSLALLPDAPFATGEKVQQVVLTADHVIAHVQDGGSSALWIVPVR